MQATVQSFRLSFWWLLGYLLVGVGALGFPAVIVELVLLARLMPGLTLDRMMFAVGVAVAIGEGIAFLAALVLVWYFKLYVGPEGLRTYNSWYVYREVAWADVLSVRAQNILGMKSLRITKAGAFASLWVPLFLSDRDGLLRLVIQYAGPEHPLAVALQEQPS